MFLYQARSLYTQAIRGYRTLEIPTLLSLGLLGTDFGFLTLSFALAYYIALNGVMYEPSRRLVLRMDLLPDSENLFIQKIGFGGLVYGQNKHLDDLNLLSITDLENKGM